MKKYRTRVVVDGMYMHSDETLNKNKAEGLVRRLAKAGFAAIVEGREVPSWVPEELTS